jgi:hypothetical protein
VLVPNTPATIEFLAPNARAFGEVTVDFVGFDEDSHGTGFDDATAPRPPWTPALAGLLIMALLALGVLVAAPWSNDAAAPPSAPTTSPAVAPRTTAVLTVAPVPTRTGWVLDPIPDGFRILGARVSDRPAATSSGDGWGDVWATPGATRTSGSWVSMTRLVADEASRAPVTDAVSFTMNGQTGWAWTDEDGVKMLRVPTVGEAEVLTISAFGRSVESLIDLAGPFALADRSPSLFSPEMFAGYELVAAGPTDQDLVDRIVLETPARTSVWYQRGTDGAMILLQVHSATPPDPRLAALAFVANELLDRGSVPPPSFIGTELTIGTRTLDGKRVRRASWRGDGSTVTMTTTLTRTAAFDLLGAARPSSATEWMALEMEVAHLQPDPQSDPGPSLPNSVVETGDDLRPGYILEPGATDFLLVGASASTDVRSDGQPEQAASTSEPSAADELIAMASTSTHYIRPQDSAFVDVYTMPSNADVEAIVESVFGAPPQRLGGTGVAATTTNVARHRTSIVTYRAGERRIVITSSMLPVDLVAHKRLIRQADESEWVNIVQGPYAYVNRSYTDAD